MNNTNVVGYVLAGRYSGALIETVMQENKLEQTYEDMKRLRALLKSDTGEKLLKVLNCPEITSFNKKKLVEEVLKPMNFSKYILNTIYLMIDKHREFAIVYFVKSFRDKYNELKNIMFVKVESPYELEESMKTRIIEYLKTTTKKEISIIINIVPELIGGIRIICGEKSIDGTIARNFELLKKSFNLIS